MATIDVNCTGMTYSIKLGFFYLRKLPKEASKHLFILGSMASFLAIPLGPLYTLSKHGMLGLFRSVEHDARAAGINLSLICPWFW